MRNRTRESLLLLPLVCAASLAATVGGPDVRIGAADDDTGARSGLFDFDQGSGNYYAVIEWQGDWTFNISTDDGASWSRRYRFLCSEGLTALDMAVSGAWVYVGYTCSIADQADLARLRRFALDTGNVDPTYGGQTIVDTAPATVVDIAVETSVDTDDDRLFYALVQSDGATRFLWDEPTDGTTFTEVPTDILDAAGGLDLHWNAGFETYSLFLSLVDQSDNIEVWRYDGAWSLSTSFPYSGSQPRTTLSAFADQVVVAYLAPATHGQGVQFRQSNDGGTSWGPPLWVAAPTAGAGDLLDVGITARGGAGLALVSNLEAGALDWALFQFKPGYQSGPWTDARSFSDFDPVTGRPIALGWTPTDHYGVIYIGGVDAIPYFDRITPPAIFLDGFESGDTSNWSSVVPRR